MGFFNKVSDTFFGPRENIGEQEQKRMWQIIDMARQYLDEIELAGPISNEDLKLLTDAKAKELRENGTFTDHDEEVVFIRSISQLREGKLQRNVGSLM